MHAGPSGPSSHATAAVARQLEGDDPAEIVVVAVAEHGPASDEGIRDERETLRWAQERGHREGRIAP